MNIRKILEFNNIICEDGLSDDEISDIESTYNLCFPYSLKKFLKVVLPVSEGFYNWRNKDIENVEYIKRIILQPERDIIEMYQDIYWPYEWGEEPENTETFKNEVLKRLELAPKLIPIFSHRYMPMIIGDEPPILSIHGVDIIYYGENLMEYLNIELGKKSQKDINFQKIIDVPFWSDIM